MENSLWTSHSREGWKRGLMGYTGCPELSWLLSRVGVGLPAMQVIYDYELTDSRWGHDQSMLGPRSHWGKGNSSGSCFHPKVR